MRAGRFLITGCSGGGKSTLLAALAARGLATVPEPGRRIVAAETDPASPRLPWNDAEGFARAALAMASADYHAAPAGPVFFDRGVLDALAGLAHATGQPLDRAQALAHRYDPPVFLAPPWPQIYVTDPERRHGLADAQAEYHRLAAALSDLGWPVVELPRAPVGARVDWVLSHL